MTMALHTAVLSQIDRRLFRYGLDHLNDQIGLEKRISGEDNWYAAMANPYGIPCLRLI